MVWRHDHATPIDRGVEKKDLWPYFAACIV